LVAELSALVLGCILRFSLLDRFPVTSGYDYLIHLRYAQWIVDHGALPPIDAFYVAYQPPLHYWFWANLLRAGARPYHLQLVSVLVGMLKLGVLWWGLRRLLPEQPLARVVALLIAAIIPAGVYLDGMASNETSLTLFSTIALALVLPMLKSSHPLRGGLSASSWR
jgi:hypothetical protein